jgi:hypothetical protein
MGDTTVGKTVKETVEILCEELHPLHIPLHTTESLKRNAKEFENVWNFPHVVGCLDGKYIRIVCPADSGAMFFNYKKYFSFVLQGLVDANSKFRETKRWRHVCGLRLVHFHGLKKNNFSRT